MKIKSLFVIVCLLVGAVFIQLSAQSDKRSVQGWFEWTVYSEIYCDGVFTDAIMGTLKFHYVFHPKSAVEIEQYKGTGESLITGESFKWRETDKVSFADNTATIKYNLKGNQGSHYIGYMTLDFSDPDYNNWVFTPIRTVCH